MIKWMGKLKVYLFIHLFLLQLFISYGTNFVDTKEERQTYLKDNYNFDCDCQACVEDWSFFSRMVRNIYLLKLLHI